MVSSRSSGQDLWNCLIIAALKSSLLSALVNRWSVVSTFLCCSWSVVMRSKIRKLVSEIEGCCGEWVALHQILAGNVTHAWNPYIKLSMPFHILRLLKEIFLGLGLTVTEININPLNAEVILFMTVYLCGSCYIISVINLTSEVTIVLTIKSQRLDLCK